MNELPPGWAETTLGDLVELVRGLTYKKEQASKNAAHGLAPLLRATNVQQGRLLLDDVLFLPEILIRDDQWLRLGDIVIASSSGSSSVVGKSAPVRQEWHGTFGAFCKVLRPTEHVEPGFVAHLVGSPSVRTRWSELAAGTNINNLKSTDVTATPIMLPPLKEQRRIVATIEEQFSRLDTADDSLRTAERRLESLRVAIVVDSMQGNWAKAGIGDISDGSRHGLAIGPFGSNLKVSDYRDDGVPLVFVRNIRSAEFHGDSTRFVSATKADELAAHRVRSGDVLVTKMGDPPGDATVYPEGFPDAIITADCIKIAVGDAFDARFVALAINAPEGKRQVLALTKGVAQKKVSLGRFKSMEIPAPPLEVQRRIVARVEASLSVVDETRRAVDAAARRCAALRRSILECAFRGELVPQDPSDEPAAALLDRNHTAAATNTFKRPRRVKA